MRCSRVLLFLLCVLIGIVLLQGCNIKQAPLVDTIQFEDRILRIPYRDIVFPLPKPPPMFTLGGKDPRQFAYKYAYHGYAPIFKTFKPEKCDLADYIWVNNNKYVNVFSSKNQIGNGIAFSQTTPYDLNTPFDFPVAYILMCHEITTRNTLQKGSIQIQELSIVPLFYFLDHHIESPSFAIVLFTKEYIYLKSYGDEVFRRYKRNLRT